MHGGIKPRIVSERYIEDSSEELNYYKIFCFGGKAYYIKVDVGCFASHITNIYSTEWDLLDLSIALLNNASLIVEKYKNLSKLIEFAEILDEPFIHARVDFYNLYNEIILEIKLILTRQEGKKRGKVVKYNSSLIAIWLFWIILVNNFFSVLLARSYIVYSMQSKIIIN